MSSQYEKNNLSLIIYRFTQRNTQINKVIKFLRVIFYNPNYLHNIILTFFLCAQYIYFTYILSVTLFI